MGYFGQDPAVLLDYRPGLDLAAAGGTFLRADVATCATYIDSSGLMRLAVANEMRSLHYINGERTILIEPASTNLCLNSNDFTAASWTTDAGITVTANQVTAPDGTLTADMIAGAVSGATVYQVVTYTADGVKAVSIYVRAGTSVSSQLVLRDVTASADLARASITWTAGVPSISGVTGGGAAFAVEALSGRSAGWYRIMITGTVVAAHSNKVQLLPDVSGAGKTVYAWGFQTENLAVPTSLIMTTTSTVTRAQDQLYFTLPTGMAVPNYVTAYVKFAERGNAMTTSLAGGNPRVFQIASSGNNNTIRLVNTSTSAPYAAITDNAGVEISQSAPGVIAYHDSVELRAVFVGPAGSVKSGKSINGGAETTGTSVSTLALPSAWQSGAKLVIASAASGFNACLALKALRFMINEQPMATIRASSITGRAAGSLPRLATPMRFPTGMQSWGSSGKGQFRSIQNVGRVWQEIYPLLDTTNPNVRALLQVVNKSQREGIVWNIQHPYWHVMKGVGGGVPVVNGANQTGNTLNISGAPPNTVQWLRQGDMIQVAGLPVVLDVAADVTTDASGLASISISPPIFAGRSPADKATVVIDPTLIFFKAVITDVSDYPQMDVTRHMDAGLTISWREQPQ